MNWWVSRQRPARVIRLNEHNEPTIGLRVSQLVDIVLFLLDSSPRCIDSEGTNLLSKFAPCSNPNLLPMKAVTIRFFSPQENKLPNPKKNTAPKSRKTLLTGYISTGGKLVFPTKTVAGLGLDVDHANFKVGVQEKKRKAKSLYLIPAGGSQQDTFQLEKAAKSYTLPLALILKKSGVDFAKIRYSFRIEPFDYEGSPAFELQLNQDAVVPKPTYTGKPRGRKPKTKEVPE